MIVWLRRNVFGMMMWWMWKCEVELMGLMFSTRVARLISSTTSLDISRNQRTALVKKRGHFNRNHVAATGLCEETTRCEIQVGNLLTSGSNAHAITQSCKCNIPTTKKRSKPSPRKSETSSKKPKSTSESTTILSSTLNPNIGVPPLSSALKMPLVTKVVCNKPSLTATRPSEPNSSLLHFPALPSSFVGKA